MRVSACVQMQRVLIRLFPLPLGNRKSPLVKNDKRIVMPTLFIIHDDHDDDRKKSREDKEEFNECSDNGISRDIQTRSFMMTTE